MKLKVYGWQGVRAEAPGHYHQTREICAAPSEAAVARAAKVKAPRDLFNLVETGNAEELRTALAEPGVIFWRGLDEWRAPFRRG